MPQRHLPMFPVGVTHITNELAFERRDGKIAYFNGHMPVFVLKKKRSARMAALMLGGLTRLFVICN